MRFLRHRVYGAFLLGLTIVILAVGCNFPAYQPSQDVSATQAAETVSARLTEAAVGSPTDEPTVPTSEPPTTEPPPTETITPSPTPSLTPTGCTDKAGFVKDVTVEDGTYIEPGETFLKTWRLINSGTCTWTSDYALVFVSGEIMGGPPVQRLEGDVEPIDTVDLSVTLTAPTKNGAYRGNWMLRNDKGILFGLGLIADKAFWVAINVGPTPTPTPTITPTPTPTETPTPEP